MTKTVGIGPVAHLEHAVGLADPLDEAALAEGLMALATDEALRAGLRRRGLEKAASFSWERTGRETAQAYLEVHEDRRAR